MLVHMLSFLLLALLMFFLQRPITFFRFDGTFLLSVVVNQAKWMADGGVFSANPLEGNAGLWFPTAMQLIPGFEIPRALADDASLPALSFAWFATEFFVTVLVVAKAFGFRTQQALAGAWIVALGAFPFYVPTLAMERLWGNPHLLSAIDGTALALVAMALVKPERSVGRNVALGFAAFVLLGYIGASQPIMTVLCWPVFGFFGLVLVFAASSPEQRRLRGIILAVLAAILALVFGRYLAGLFLYAKTTFFWNDLIPQHIGWRQESFFLESGRRWLGPILWLGAIAGAILMARRRESVATSRFALGYLAFVAGTTALTLAVFVSGRSWRGPVMSYFDLVVLPLHACFLGVAVLAAIPERAHRFRLLPWIAALLPWVVLLVWKPPYDRPSVRNEDPFLWPPRRTELVERLERDIGLTPGAAFRGRVANLAGTDYDPAYKRWPFANQHNSDALVLYLTENDHRMYGLWYFGIPTLIENNQFSSPFFHFLTSRLLAEPDALHTRPQTTLTRFDERVLAQLGVRYVLHDHQIPGRDPVFVQRVGDGRRQWLYEVRSPNTAGVSPVRVVIAKDAAEAMAAIRDPAFDFSTSVALFDELPRGTNLVRARPGTLRFYRDHVEIAASSEGVSMLVLPLEYSRCLVSHLRDRSGRAPALYRANLHQVGVRFEGELRGTLSLRFSPFVNPGCRFEDYQDARRLRLGEVPSVAR